MTKITCTTCRGTGSVTRDLRDMHGIIFYKNGLAPCDACGGKGTS